MESSGHGCIERRARKLGAAVLVGGPASRSGRWGLAPDLLDRLSCLAIFSTARSRGLWIIRDDFVTGIPYEMWAVASTLQSTTEELVMTKSIHSSKSLHVPIMCVIYEIKVCVSRGCACIVCAM